MTRSTLAALCLLTLAGATALALSTGFFGRVHPAFDAVSNFRLHLAAGLAIMGAVLLFTQFRREGVFVVVLAVAAMAVTPGGMISRMLTPDAKAEPSPADQPVYRLLQFNARYDNKTPEAFLSLVGQTRPDVITMQEVSSMWRGRLAALNAAYPYRVICDARGSVGGVAILSRRPFLEGTEPGCLDGGTFALATVDLGGDAVQIAALHLYWPWPYQQPEQIERLSAVLAGLSETAILAGDFNAVRWSHSVQSIAAMARMKDHGPAGATWLSRRLPDALRPIAGLGIDHVLAGQAIIGHGVTRTPPVGSDHLPVQFEFSLKQAEQPASPTTDVVERAELLNPTS